MTLIYANKEKGYMLADSQAGWSHGHFQVDKIEALDDTLLGPCMVGITGDVFESKQAIQKLKAKEPFGERVMKLENWELLILTNARRIFVANGNAYDHESFVEILGNGFAIGSGCEFFSGALEATRSLGQEQPILAFEIALKLATGCGPPIVRKDLNTSLSIKESKSG